MEEEIYKATKAALAKHGTATRTDINGTVFTVERPADASHGDYSVNAALAGARVYGASPVALANELVQIMRQTLGEKVSKVEVAGPGFINITVSRDEVARHISYAAEARETWGMNDSRLGSRVIIEFSNTNAFKEMHIGHLMSTVIGESLARIIESAGATVARDSYGGDVGPHVAKALWGLRARGITEPATAEEIGEAYAHGSRSYEESEKAKAEIDELNTSIYKGDDAALMELWRKGRDVSVDAFKDLYRILDTHFDYLFFESETAPIGMRVVNDELERGVFERSEGAVIYQGEKVGLHTLVFITSRGTPTYEAKDVGLAFLKEERWPSDESIIVTAAEQIGHFTVFLAALSEIAPLLAAKTKHVAHGFLRLSTGKMSSREGNVVTAASLIKDAIERTRTKNEDPLIAEQVAMGAIKYSILRSSAGSDIIYDMEKSLSLEGDSGPYLQYALVRAKSIITSADTEKNAVRLNISDMELPAEAYMLERLIMRFPAVVAEAQKLLSPHTIAHYLTELASEWNSFYARERILGGDFEEYKLVVVRAFVHTMQNGLKLLGIPAPERM